MDFGVEERRRHPRFVARCDYLVRLRAEGVEEVCRVGNISRRGLYVESKFCPDTGESVEVELFTEGRGEVEWVGAKVRRVARTWDPRSRSPVVGLGLELHPRDSQQIEFLIRAVLFARSPSTEHSEVLLIVKDRAELIEGTARYQARIEFEQQDIFLIEPDSESESVHDDPGTK